MPEKQPDDISGGGADPRSIVTARNALSNGYPDALEYQNGLVLYSFLFDGDANGQTNGHDLDNTDFWDSPFRGRCRAWAWQPFAATRMSIAYNPNTGRFTWGSAAANQTGFLYVWATE